MCPKSTFAKTGIPFSQEGRQRFLNVASGDLACHLETADDKSCDVFRPALLQDRDKHATKLCDVTIRGLFNEEH